MAVSRRDSLLAQPELRSDSRLGKRMRRSVTPEPKVKQSILDLSSPTPEPSTPPPSKRSLLPQDSWTSVAATESTLVDTFWRGTRKDGPFVWILLDPDTWQVPAFVDETRDSHLLWWPAKVIQFTKVPRIARLYGVLQSARVVKLHNPPPETFCSLVSSDRLRFEEPCFHNCPFEGAPSPRKKPRLDRSELRKTWEQAVTQALQEKIVEEEDGLPPPAIMACRLWKDPPTTNDHLNGELTSLESEEEEEPFVWVDDGEADQLEIPGELILARGVNKLFWPARIVSQKTPTKPKEKRKYRIEWCDRTPEKWMPRSAFFTLEEEGFATCKMGELETEVGFSPDDSDSDDIVVPSSTRYNNPTDQHSPSPEVQPFNDGDEFCDLPLRQQLGYVKPILLALLDGKYPPAEENRTMFLEGGKKRLVVMQKASRRGVMGKKEVEELNEMLVDWVLKGERFAKRADISLDTELDVSTPVGEHVKSIEASSESSNSEEVDIMSSNPTLPACHVDEFHAPHPPTSTSSQDTVTSLNQTPTPPTRLKGDPAYEALSPVDKIEFCANVILPEAILQLHLWREEMRTSIDVLPEREERRLHSDGDDLLERRDWVVQIKNMRKTAEERLRKGSGHRNGKEKQDKGKKIIGGTSTRPVYG